VTAKKKKPTAPHKKRKPVNAVLISEQPLRVKVVTPEPPPPGSKKVTVWDALATVRQALFFGFWIGVGLTPIGAHIISQFYCGTAEKLRCNPIEFPAWLEAGGIIVALIFANAAKDVVSKSAKQLAEAAKGWLPWAKKNDPPAGGEG
jgi:hypothetical protein